MKRIVLLLLSVLFFNCNKDDNNQNTVTDSFDKTAMLTHWANNIILPSYEDYVSKTKVLKSETEKFTTTPNQTNLESLRTAWKNAYLSFQSVGMFDFGKAYEIQLKEFSNTYPLNVTGVESNISSGTYNFTLISQMDKQGFPALDYLLFGLGDTDDKILEFYTTHTSSSSYKKYLSDVSGRLNNLSEQVLNSWNSGYKQTYVSSIGNSVTSSVNITVNAYVKYFEKDVRSGKVGIPAGVFSTTILSEKTEGYYSKIYSREFYQASLNAVHHFFIGKNYSNSNTGLSLNAYLDYVNKVVNGSKLSLVIDQQFKSIKNQALLLDSNFTQQINSDNTKMLAIFDEMQKVVIYFKIDMMQALNIAVDYVDADGD